MGLYLLGIMLGLFWPALLFLLALYVAAYGFFFWIAGSAGRGDQWRSFLGDAFYADRKSWPRVTLIVSSIFVGYRAFGGRVAWDGSDLLLGVVFALGAWGPGPRRLPGLLFLLALYVAAYAFFLLQDFHYFGNQVLIYFPVFRLPELAVSIVLMYCLGLNLRRDVAVDGSAARVATSHRLQDLFLPGRLVFSLLVIAAVVSTCLWGSVAIELNEDKEWIVGLIRRPE